MKLLIIFGVLLAAVYADQSLSGSRCKVGSWREWSKCVMNKNCEQTPKRTSFPIPINPGWDKGRANMETIMKAKQMLWTRRETCRASGECPELLARPSSGSFKCKNGLANDLPCDNIDQMSFLNFVDQGYTEPIPSDTTRDASDIWGWVDPLNGDEYAIVCLSGGTSFVRITDPANPVPVGFMYPPTNASHWHDVKVLGNYAYVVSEAKGHGLQVFDLTRLRGRQTVEYFEPDAVNEEFGSAHNVAVNEETDFVYVVGAKQSEYCAQSKGGLMIFDVSNPLKPTLAGVYADDGYTHDAQCVVYHGPDTRYTGHEICFCYNEDSLTIVDVTRKSNIKMLSKEGYIGAEYVHQGWVTEDHELLLLDDEMDENDNAPDDQITKSYIWDIKDLEKPTLVNTFKAAHNSIDHNQYIIGDLTYQSNYESGLRILHINRTSSTLSEVAYFDVYPSSTEAQFNGAWSVFPYYPSGTVAISSIEYGLFVVRPNMVAIRSQIASGNVAKSTMTRTRKVISNAPGSTCPPLVETKFCQNEPVLC